MNTVILKTVSSWAAIYRFSKSSVNLQACTNPTQRTFTAKVFLTKNSILCKEYDKWVKVEHISCITVFLLLWLLKRVNTVIKPFEARNNPVQLMTWEQLPLEMK